MAAREKSAAPRAIEDFDGSFRGAAPPEVEVEVALELSAGVERVEESAIQAGAILAVVAIYRERLWNLLVGFRKPENFDYAFKLAVAFGVTAIGGLAVKALGWELPETVTPIAWALILGGAWMLLAEHFAAKRAAALGERAAITWTVAILVGIAQVVAGVFPGTSRSGATIIGGLLFGLSRKAATE
ncbi:MAG: hypothetical protein HUU04_09185, partial [Verrucomicrobiae bacterium]|nr:hypothetical protein [Verrucomicrobiae bacterium]